MKTNSKSRIMEEMRETAQDMYECGIIDKHRFGHHKALYDASREPEYTEYTATMDKKRTVDIGALIAQKKPIIAAVRRGAREAMKRHIQAGVPMVSQRDGKMVMLSPEEMREMLAKAEKE